MSMIVFLHQLNLKKNYEKSYIFKQNLTFFTKHNTNLGLCVTRLLLGQCSHCVWPE